MKSEYRLTLTRWDSSAGERRSASYDVLALSIEDAFQIARLMCRACQDVDPSRKYHVESVSRRGLVSVECSEAWMTTEEYLASISEKSEARK